MKELKADLARKTKDLTNKKKVTTTDAATLQGKTDVATLVGKTDVATLEGTTTDFASMEVKAWVSLIRQMKMSKVAFQANQVWDSSTFRRISGFFSLRRTEPFLWKVLFLGHITDLTQMVTFNEPFYCRSFQAWSVSRTFFQALQILNFNFQAKQLAESATHVKATTIIMMELPLPAQHASHQLSTESCMSRRIHPKVRNRIHQLVQSGIDTDYIRRNN